MLSTINWRPKYENTGQVETEDHVDRVDRVDCLSTLSTVSTWSMVSICPIENIETVDRVETVDKGAVIKYGVRGGGAEGILNLE